MADFDPPFAGSGERREPTTDEQASGFGCGAAQLPLFNWLLWALQSEVGEVIDFAGLTPNNGDMTQLRQAIQALISAATGGGDTSNFVLMTQARVRLPIFPDVQTANGHFSVITPSTGQIRIPSGVTFLHRGIFSVTTVQEDIVTDASKTYHLRWNPTDGFALKDLAAPAYNPGTLAETHASFDSTYDDMLLARVVTNSSNVPTITNLSNKNKLVSSTEATGSATRVTTGTLNDTIRYQNDFALNWARTPLIVLTGWTFLSAGQVNVEGFTNKTFATVHTRYNVNARIETDYFAAVPPASTISGLINLFANG